MITQGFSETVVELEQSVPPKLIEETWSRIQGKLDQVSIPDGAAMLYHLDPQLPFSM